MATASDWWDIYYEGMQDAVDYTGRQIKKSAFNQQGSKFGWVLEYIMPLDKGGTDSYENVWVVSCDANILRGGKTTYSIDGKRYQVKRDDKGGYDIYLIGDKRLSFWESEFGNATEAEDFAGRVIHKGAYGQVRSRFGWDIDHIQPLSLGGKNVDENKQIVHVLTNDEKSDKTTFVSDDGRQYQVQKTSKVESEYWANGYDYSEKKYCIVEIA